jgi:hypothetical protein
MAETGKTKTYPDAIEALLNKSAVLPPEFLDEDESFITGNDQLGYATKKEFIQEAVRSRLMCLEEEKPQSKDEATKNGHISRAKCAR